MWCPNCQSDVATEVAADGQALLCSACGDELRQVFAPSLHPETLSARELLERWATSDLLDNIPVETPDLSDVGPPPSAARRPRDDRSTRAGDNDAERPRVAPKKPKFRIDNAHPLSEVIEGAAAPTSPAAGDTRGSAGSSSPPSEKNRQHRQRTDAPHTAFAGPHFDVQQVIKPPVRGGNSESLWGQLLAYAGVGVLTIGTVLVLWGHFGGLTQYASTGWLVATGGQMLLFLGVVTLVSGGMQQTTQEVSQQVEHIGERIIRIEHSTRDLLRGPHFGHTADREAVLQTRQRQESSDED
ncbi:MAG: hypothetical protein R3B90_06795 [Planctomycetaceae bacterium]